MVTSSEVLEVIVVSMRDAFLAVTVFVAAMVLLFSWLQYITAGKFVDVIRANTRWQPVIGALMGITPGCGGAIVMMPMYARGYVTYGTVIATLIATLGDAAFVLIGAAVTDSTFIAPVIAVHVISFIVGIIWGYLVDVMNITPSNPFGKFGPTFEDNNLYMKVKIKFREKSLMTLEEKMKTVGDTSYFTKVILFGGLSLLLVLYLQFYYWFGLRRMQNSYSKLIIIH